MPERLAQGGIILADSFKISAGVVLRPELVGKAISEISEGGETLIQIDCFCQECAQIMDLAEFPTTAEEICFEESLAGLLE